MMKTALAVIGGVVVLIVIVVVSLGWVINKGTDTSSGDTAYTDAFSKSFLDSCQQRVVEGGGTVPYAKAICSCELKNYRITKSIPVSAEACLKEVSPKDESQESGEPDQVAAANNEHDFSIGEDIDKSTCTQNATTYAKVVNLYRSGGGVYVYKFSFGNDWSYIAIQGGDDDDNNWVTTKLTPGRKVKFSSYDCEGKYVYATQIQVYQ
jgi:hypothetical protein